MKTFYLAGASSEYQLVREHAQKLINLGLAWVGDVDWTTAFEEDENDPSAWPRAVLLDLAAAQTADLFGVFATPRLSFGAGGEFGARIALGRSVHIILHQRLMDHAFFAHPLVTVWKNWAQFEAQVQHWTAVG